MASSENPYEPPLGGAETKPAQVKSFNSPTLERKLVVHAQILLRLLGIFLLVDGLAGLAAGVVYFYVQSSVWREAGYTPSVDEYGCAWIAYSLVVFVAGICFIIGGGWVLEKIVLPSSIGIVPENDAKTLRDS